MSHRIAVAGLVGLLLLAGCGGLPGDADTTTGASTTTTAEQERVIAAPPSDDETTGSPSGTATTSTTGTTPPTNTRTTATSNRDVGYEVRASNADATGRNLVVTITPANGSTPAFDDSTFLASNESREFDFGFPRAGTYEVTVGVGNETVTRQWELGARDPDSGLSVYVAPDGEVHVDIEAI